MAETTAKSSGKKRSATAKTPEEKARGARRSSAAESQPVRAVAKYLRFSAQKGRLVVDQIRGRHVADAATLLMFSERAASREVLKVLKSAVANAEHNHELSPEELYVKAVFVDEGPTFKRWKPRARGRADRINKRTCHVTIVVDVAPEELVEKRERRAGKTAAGAGDRAARVAASQATKEAPAKPKAKKQAKRASDAPEAAAPDDAVAVDAPVADTPAPEVVAEDTTPDTDAEAADTAAESEGSES